MEWFSGDVGAAISTAKSKKAIFCVFVTGKCFWFWRLIMICRPIFHNKRFDVLLESCIDLFAGPDENSTKVLEMVENKGKRYLLWWLMIFSWMLLICTRKMKYLRWESLQWEWLRKLKLSQVEFLISFLELIRKMKNPRSPS